jgi:ABC-type glutathione transport system ATPase component
VDHASLDIRPAEVVGILGESGCGKSTLALALLRQLPPHARYDSGSILFAVAICSRRLNLGCANFEEHRIRQFYSIQ